MRVLSGLTMAAGLAAISLCLQGQTPAAKDAPTEAKGLPPRAAPGDYLAQTQVGGVTLGAEFKRHSIPTAQGALTTEDYVVVELGLFGGTDGRVKLSADEFTLRINGKKPLPAQPFGVVLASTKDPEYEPPIPAASKSKGGITGGAGGGGGQQADKDAPPPPIPLEVVRGMAQRVRKAALPEGDRTLPIAGLLFFQYRGKAQGISSVELMYAGAAGKATLALQP